jgi:hypothetical protein
METKPAQQKLPVKGGLDIENKSNV